VEKNKGILFIVSGPSGAGKTSLCGKLTSIMPDLKFSVSCTTRMPRQDERDGINYLFISREEFVKRIEQGDFLEWAEVHGELYGTLRTQLEAFSNSGISVILDIDTQGALQVREKFGSAAVYIFVLPPSLAILRERLEKRMSNTKADIDKRLETAIREIRQYHNYDYVIVNTVLDDALRELQSVVFSQRVKTNRINHHWIKNTFLIEEE
jgi:guanylate kinase